jgi:hypothetical protein
MSCLMHNKRYGLALSLNGWVEGRVGKGICHSKGGLSVYIGLFISITNKQFASCKPFQKNLWAFVNCACSIKVSVESLDVILLRNVDGQSVCQ